MNDFMNYDFDISDIVLACYVSRGGSTRVHKNRPSHGLALHLSGVKVYTFADGKRFTVEKNDLLYLPKGSDYVVDVPEDGDCYAINFDLFSDTVFPPFCFCTKNLGLFTQMFSDAEQAFRKKTDGHLLRIKSLLYHILFSLCDEYRTDYVTHDTARRILPAVRYIHEHYTEDMLSLPVLTGLCDMSDTYFRRIFKSCYGVSPVRYIQSLRLNHAAELIASGLYSVHDAAFCSGFSDDSYFTREFKKAFLVSPSVYKKQHS